MHTPFGLWVGVFGSLGERDEAGKGYRVCEGNTIAHARH